MTLLLRPIQDEDCSTHETTSIELLKQQQSSLLLNKKNKNDHEQQQIPRVLNLDSLQIFTWEDLRRVNLLGRGTYADVYRMIDQKSPSRRNYAVKLLNSKRWPQAAAAASAAAPEQTQAPNSSFSLPEEDGRSTAQTDLIMEASILSQLDHENIIKLRGISSNFPSSSSASRSEDADSASMFLLFDVLQETLKDRITRWRRSPKSRKVARAASLDSLLSRVRRIRPGGGLLNHHHQNGEDVSIINQMYDRMQSVALEVVKAMKYLHENDILLRDLKPANIGFTADGRVQLFDFGFARHIDDCSQYEVAGTPRFMAPEVVEGEGYSFASDVYSFGVVLHELCTLHGTAAKSASCPPNKRGGLTGAGGDQKANFKSKVSSLREDTSRLSLDSIPCRATKELIRVCLSNRARDRPSFAVIEKTLNNILLELVVD